jgi:hypothetical protein
MIETLGRVSAFWWGKKLSVIEIASMLSIQRAGHQIQLFSYEKPRQLPAGVAWFNAAEILPKESFVFFRGNNPALGANLFRYKLMAAEKGIWMDTDILLLKPVPLDGGELYGWQDEHEVNNAVLFLPPESPVLRDLLDFTRNEHPIPPFFEKFIQNELAVLRLSGKPVHVSRMRWGVWGPLALTYFIKKNRHEHLARAREVFYPVHHSEAHMLVTSGFDVDARIGPSTLAVHLWNAKLRQPSKIRPAADRDQIHIDSDSYFGRFCRKELQLKVSG